MRSARVLRAALLAGAMLGAGSAAATGPDARRGTASVIDGDSLILAGEEIRLEGIDAPEALQTCTVRGRRWHCGRAASETLAFLLQGAEIRCTWRERDSYGRALGTCYRGDIDINAMMVELGMALAYRHYTARYDAEEARARAARHGLWDAEFEPPWQWRRRQPRTPASAAECAVKGNVNRHGERIYHERGSPAYPRVRIRPDEGDRCFDSPAAARAGGFRAPRR